MVLYRTIFLVKGSIGQVWNSRVLYRTQRNLFFKSVELFRGSKYVALMEPFKVLYRTFSSKIVGYSAHRVVVNVFFCNNVLCHMGSDAHIKQQRDQLGD